MIGPPARNSSVKVEAANVGLMAKTKSSKKCEPLLFQAPAFQWTVNAPAGQSATVSNSGTLSPTVNVGGPGRYTAVLTLCPLKCKLQRGRKSMTVGPVTRTVPIDVTGEAAPPPETRVTEPSTIQDPSGQGPMPGFVPPLRAAKCAGLGGITSPEWVPTQRFGGASDYHFVEGPVTWSRVATEDNPLNHASEDFEWTVVPDAPYERLRQGYGGAEFKTEWEGRSIPEAVRPTADLGSAQPADRVSTYGFWIFDCGHPPWKTELHPPVGVVTQRPRPVQIPPSYRPTDPAELARFPNGFGSNIWVPGVVADIWFNKNSGRNGSCTVHSSMHQPVPRLPWPADCVGNPHPLNRTFTFNVYLPRSPELVARELGRSNPEPVPLFMGTEKLSGGTGGPDPTWQKLTDANGVTFLRGTVDLTGLKEDQYRRRVSIAWAYPSPDNWGATRFRIALNTLNVLDDADADYYLFFGKGDWRFSFNTNNRDQEWTELFSCDECVDDNHTYNLDVSTGVTHGRNGKDPKKARDIGPDPVVFPGQPLLVRTSGYDDEIKGQDIGTMEVAKSQQDTGFWVEPSGVKAGSYRLGFTIRALGSVGPASLTPQANALFRSYNGGGAQCGGGTAAARAAPECVATNPETATGGKPVVRLGSLPGAEHEGGEPGGHALMEISAKNLRHDFKSLRGSRAKRRVLEEVKSALERVPKKLRGDYEPLVKTFERALPRRLVLAAIPRALRRSAKLRRKQARRHRAHRHRRAH